MHAGGTTIDAQGSEGRRGAVGARRRLEKREGWEGFCGLVRTEQAG